MYSRFTDDIYPIYHNLKQNPQNIHLLSPTLLVLFTQSAYVLYDLNQKQPISIFRNKLWNFAHIVVKQTKQDELIILNNQQLKLFRLAVTTGNLQKISDIEGKAWLIAQRNLGNFHLVTLNQYHSSCCVDTFNFTHKFKLNLDGKNHVIHEFADDIVIYGSYHDTFSILNPSTQRTVKYKVELEEGQRVQDGQITQVIHSVVENRGMALVCLVRKHRVRMIWLRMNKKQQSLQFEEDDFTGQKIRQIQLHQPNFLNFKQYFEDGRLILENCTKDQVIVELYKINKDTYLMDSFMVPSRWYQGLEVLGTSIVPKTYEGNRCKTVVQVHKVVNKNSIYCNLMKKIQQKYGGSVISIVLDLLNNEFK